MRIGLAQINTRVGAIEENTDKALHSVALARDQFACELVLLPELTLSGYPPEDLLLHRGMRSRLSAGLQRFVAQTRGIAAYVGYPEYASDKVFNSAALVSEGRIVANHRKNVLPNYAVFDEKRYFEPGEHATVAECGGIRFGLIICEDIWEPGPARQAVAAGAEIILVINGSPYHIAQQGKRESLLGRRAVENDVPLVYLNMVGGQDELVFDGGSFAVDRLGRIVFRGPRFEEALSCLEIDRQEERVVVRPGTVSEPLQPEQSVYSALVTGTRDYVEKNGFPGVVIGLSGGIDSALTLAVAVDALGPERVRAVMMPSQYTSQISLDDAAAQARSMGVAYDVLSIEPILEAVGNTLQPLFAGCPTNTTEENIQARCRGLLLMAISNKLGPMLLTTGNKSEMAVGYATLYGDMAGGFAPLKDCSKTLVYRLSRYRNSVSAVIPARVISREPSAELRPDQKDSDSLPSYEVLDAILEAFIEQDFSVEQIVALGFERETVVRVLQMVKRAEYKRRQAPPGVRVSNRAFGRDWRYPITSGY